MFQLACQFSDILKLKLGFEILFMASQSIYNSLLYFLELNEPNVYGLSIFVPKNTYCLFSAIWLSGILLAHHT